MMKRKIDAQHNQQLVKEIEEWKSKYLRALADYQNLEKRVQTQRQEDIQFAARDLIVKILPILDALEKAEQLLNDQGLQLTVKQFRDVLSSEGVEKFTVLGKKFDPHLMECVEAVESDKEGEVIEEVRAGYTMHEKVIRVVQVKVGKKRVNQKAEEMVKEELRKGDYM
jgi:molecular chaperone GrpE